MLDKSRIGYSFPAFQVTLEEGRLRFFAKAIGETNPAYTDIKAASERGYHSLPMPPTFAFCLGKEAPDPNDVFALFGVNIADVLHGEQSFEYHSVPCARDVLTVRRCVMDVYERKGGSLGFIVLKIEVTGKEDQPVCEAVQTIVIKQRSAGPS